MVNSDIRHLSYTEFVAVVLVHSWTGQKNDVRESIITFFDTIVDENMKKFLLAVATLIQSYWFLCCDKKFDQISSCRPLKY